MKGIWKRIIAYSMALLLLLALLPSDALGAEVRQALAGDVWAAIGELEQEGLEGSAVLMETGSDPAKDPDYYASLSEEVEALVTARPDYEPGSVIRHGDFFFWKDTSGVVYGYSPDLRAQLNGAYSPDDVPEEMAAEAEDTEDIEAKIAALEQAQAARTETASEEAVLMGGTTTNPDIAVFIPHYPDSDDRFTKSAYYRGLQIAEATGGTCTCYNGADVTIDSLAKAMTQCGVILFHTHGSTDAYYEDRSDPGNTAYFTIKNEEGIDWTGKDGEKDTGQYGDYYHVYKSGDTTYCIDGTAIVNHVKGPVVTDLFGLCCCMGMKNDGLCRPLRDAGVEVVYGYSQSVTFATDKLHQRFLAEALVKGLDGGGIAGYMKEQMCQYGLEHWTLTENTRKNLTSLGSICWDPYHNDAFTEEQARNNGDAFLLFCSSEDPYPAEGQRDRAQTVKSTWKLSLAGGGTGSGNIRMSAWTGAEIENYFPNVTSIEQLSGSLPGSVVIQKQFVGEELADALFGNVGDTPGSYEATFRVTFTDGTTGTRRAEILVMDREIQSAEQTVPAEAGTEQEIQPDYGDPGKVFDYEILSGELPPGMVDAWNEASGLRLRGTPTLPGWYVSVWRVMLSSGRVIDHTLRVHVPGTVVETSESMLVKNYDSGRHYLAAKDPSAVVQTDLLSGALPPGMDWGYSMSEAPYISGKPAEEGSFSARFRFLCSDGTVQYHTVNVTAFEPGHPISSYTVYVGGGEARVPKKQYDDYLANSFYGAMMTGEISWNKDKYSGVLALDLDTDGSFDVIATPSEDGKYMLFQKEKTCSVSGDVFKLTLTDEAKTAASVKGGYAEEIVFRLADRFELYVDGVQVTTENMQNILGDGPGKDVFSFDGGVTLSVHGDYTASGEKPLILNKMPNLVIQVDDNSTLRSKTDCIRAENSMTIRGGGKLTLETPGNGIAAQSLVELLNLDLEINAGKKGITGENVGTPHLRVIRSNVDIDSGTGAVYDFWSISLDHSLIAEPAYGYADDPLPATVASYQCLVDRDRSLLNQVKIKAYSKEYDLWINGIRVTDQNQMDVLGDGKFSYAEYAYGNNVLNIGGSLESSETILRSEIDGLRIIAAPDTVLKTSRMYCLDLCGDTTVSGGPLTVISTSKMGGGINVQSGSTLTVSLMDLTVEGGRYGINAEAYAGNSLMITLSNVAASGPSGAICGFTSGIDQFNCTLLLPEEGLISKGTVMDGEKPAAKAVIGSNFVSAIGKDLSYNLYLPGSGTARLIAAWYDADGKLLGTAVTEKPRGGFVSGAIQVKQGADHYKLFALDKNSAPIIKALP